MAATILIPEEEIIKEDSSVQEGSLYDLLRKMPVFNQSSVDVGCFKDALDGHFGDDVKREVEKLYAKLVDLGSSNFSRKAYQCYQARY